MNFNTHLISGVCVTSTEINGTILSWGLHFLWRMWMFISIWLCWRILLNQWMCFKNHIRILLLACQQTRSAFLSESILFDYQWRLLGSTCDIWLYKCLCQQNWWTSRVMPGDKKELVALSDVEPDSSTMKLHLNKGRDKFLIWKKRD